jgi:hypothetical protein
VSPLAKYFVEAGFAVTSGGLQLRVPRRPNAATPGAPMNEAVSAPSPEPRAPELGDA